MKAPLSYYTDEELTAELSSRAQRHQAMSEINAKTEFIAELFARAAQVEKQGNALLAERYRKWADRETFMRNTMCDNLAKGCWHEQPPPVHRPGKSLENHTTPASL